MRHGPSRAVLLGVLLALGGCGGGGGTDDDHHDDGLPGSWIDPAPFINVYHVAPDGDDANPGTLEAPWATAQHAADTVAAGDLVYLRGGTYNQGFTVTTAGTSDNRLAFAAYPDERPLFDGRGVDRGNGILIGADYITLHGLAAARWEGNAVWAEYASHLVITECVVRDVDYGIGLGPGCNDFTIENTTAHHFLLYGFDVTCDQADPCSRGVFNHCTSHTGSDPDQNVDGFALGHYHTHDITMNHCVTHDVYDGFDISASNATLNGCVAHHCGNGGFKLWQDGVTLNNCVGYDNSQVNAEVDWDPDVGPTNTTLNNCTLAGSETFNLVVEDGASSLHLNNTIVAGGDNIALAFLAGDATNYRGDHNLWHNRDPERLIVVMEPDREYALSEAAAWQADTGQDAGSLFLESMDGVFADPEQGDYHLAPASPALGKADCAAAPATDLEGNDRPRGDGCDIGAYEQ